MTASKPPISADMHALTLAVGEMRGQMRELVHGQNNMVQKVDVIAERSLLAPTASDFSDLRQRVDALERANDRRDGATGLGMALLKSPVVAWLVGITAAAFAAIKGGLLK